MLICLSEAVEPGLNFKIDVWGEGFGLGLPQDTRQKGEGGISYTMRCAERENLINLLTNSLMAYQALRAMKGLDSTALETKRQWLRETHEICEHYRQALAAHERTHRCATAPMMTSAR